MHLKMCLLFARVARKKIRYLSGQNYDPLWGSELFHPLFLGGKLLTAIFSPVPTHQSILWTLPKEMRIKGKRFLKKKEERLTNKVGRLKVITSSCIVSKLYFDILYSAATETPERMIINCGFLAFLKLLLIVGLLLIYTQFMDNAKQSVSGS